MRWSECGAASVLSIGLIMVGLGLAAPLLASDGVLQINQACATNEGCFPGDSPGFPVTITQPGSYRLTGDLTVSANGVSGITISSDSVALDLGGFTISGPVVCTGFGSTIACPNDYGATGVDASESRQVSIRNGVIRGLEEGVEASKADCRIVELDATSNADDGVRTSSCDIAHVNAGSNGHDGFNLGVGTLSDVTATYNGSVGIDLIGGVIKNSFFVSNGGSGAKAIATLLKDTFFGFNNGNGIEGAKVSVLDCVIEENEGWGLDVLANSGAVYSGNQFLENTSGSVHAESGATATEIGTNFCGTNTTCP